MSFTQHHTCFEDPSDPFSTRFIIHEDHYRHQTAQQKAKKKHPDPYIASQRLSFRQLRAFASKKEITNPEDCYMWDGKRVGDYSARTMLLNYVN